MQRLEFLGDAVLDYLTTSYLYSALGDLVESCVGAILLDSGFNLEVVWKIMISFLDPVMKFSALQLNPIRELQELCQFYNWELTFPSVKKDGVFSVDAVVDGKEVCETACATNSNKKTAKRIASQKLYLSLKLSQKMEARLIGYDEIPSNIDVSFADHIEDLKSNEVRNISREVQSRPVNSAKSSRYIQRMVQPTPD
ncbi:Double-stranded RNA-binding, partial [Cynara cardunculus var. scolymus]